MKLTNINKIYHNKNNTVHALKDLDFTVDTCGITVILGSSGCGKTTLLQIMAGSDRDYTGNVEVEGMVGIIAQDIALLETMSVENNLKLVCDDDNRVTEVLDRFQLKEERKKKVKKLSTGQKKRVQILRMILQTPDILLCDEPTAALDHDNSILVMETLRSIAQDIPVVIVTHELAICDEYADRVCTLEHGKMINDEIRNVQAPYKKQEEQMIKPKRNVISFLAHYMTSRLGETCMYGVLLLFLLFAVYAGMNLFGAVSSASKEKEAWRTSQNIVVTQAKDENFTLDDAAKKEMMPGDQGSCTSATQCAYRYDVYTPLDHKRVMSEIDGVIGVRFGWNFDLYAESHFMPVITKEDAIQLVDEATKAKEEDRQSIQRLKQQLTSYSSIYFDERNYDGFARSNMLVEDRGDIFNTGFSAPIRVYETKQSYEFPLIYGRQRQSDQEVILSLNAAEDLQKGLKLDSLEDLLDREVELVMRNYTPPNHDGRYIIGSNSEGSLFLRVAGITSMNNAQELQVFVNEGVYETKMMEANQLIPEYLVYQYLTFLLDPSKDVETLSQEINAVLPGTNSSFVPYVESIINTTSEVYQNPMIFYLFAIIAVGASIMLLILFEYFSKTRQRKEWTILYKAQYDLKQVVLNQYGSILGVCAILFVVTLPYMITKINELALAAQFPMLLQMNWLMVGATIVLVAVLLILVKYTMLRNILKSK